MASPLACEKFWVDRTNYDEAEKKYYEYMAQLSLGKNSNIGQTIITPMVETVAETPKKEKSPPRATVVPSATTAALQTEAEQSKVKKDKKKNKKTKKEASESPEPAETPATRVITQIVLPPAVTATQVVADDAAKEQNKKKAKKNKKNKTNQDAVPITNNKLLTGTDKVQQENAKNLKEKENLAHKLCDNITEELTKMSSFPAQCTLASEISKARQHIKNSLERMDGIAALAASPGAELLDRLSTVEKENEKLRCVIDGLNNLVIDLHARVKALESGSKSTTTAQVAQSKPVLALVKKAAVPEPVADDDEDDDDVDLFGSEEEEEDKAAAELREKRLAEYAAKKSKKPALIAKSNIILDIKPWDDETDMKMMEQEVRKISADGLLLGASKLVPLAYGIHKLQLSCVIEDDKISVDWLQEEIEKLEDYVQSVDIAAFNKI